jgi:exoribonuclease R
VRSTRQLRSPAPAPGELAADFADIRRQFQVTPEFPADLEAEAREAAARPLPGDRRDLRALDFFTVDPPGSMDLDQAMHLERAGDGYRVRYALADIGHFVDRGSALEAEAWTRGVTVYSPDVRAPLYPQALSEGAASLLPDQDRPAIVFTIDIDRDGRRRSAGVRPAIVRSRARLDYAGLSGPRAQLLEAIGRLRERRERERGGVRLPSLRQMVVHDPKQACGYRLEWERKLPAEDWNAQISLVTGIAAARIMLEHAVGLLRTQSGIDSYRLAALRRTAAALHVDWPKDVGYADFVRRLDPVEPRHAALLEEAHGVMGRAGYTAFSGSLPADPEHAALATPYAHCTAPMRRLADRYVLDLVAGLAGGRAPSAADVETLARLPDVMDRAEERADQLERAIVDDAEARLLEHRVGEEFSAVVVDIDRRGARLQVAEPPVRARLHDGPMPELGTAVCVRLDAADPRSRSLRFAHCEAVA